MINYKKISILIIAVTLIFVIAVVVFGLSMKSGTANTSYTLKAYRNTVALYQNDNLIKTYDDIVLNTLPISDINRFKSGITVSSENDAIRIIEDYDG
ncbi:MAG: hypothetical protein MJ076_00120 [Clostridia bacterium]|nr:hypothetical protein [Clostridia bacterium]